MPLVTPPENERVCCALTGHTRAPGPRREGECVEQVAWEVSCCCALSGGGIRQRGAGILLAEGWPLYLCQEHARSNNGGHGYTTLSPAASAPVPSSPTGRIRATDLTWTAYYDEPAGVPVPAPVPRIAKTKAEKMSARKAKRMLTKASVPQVMKNAISLRMKLRSRVREVMAGRIGIAPRDALVGGTTLKWTKVPTKAEATRIALMWLAWEQPGMGLGNHALYSLFNNRDYSMVACGHCSKACTIHQYASPSWKKQAHPLSPWVSKGCLNQDERLYVCIACASKHIWRKAMAYRKLVVLQWEQEKAREAAGGKAARTKKQISASLRSLTAQDILHARRFEFRDLVYWRYWLGTYAPPVGTRAAADWHLIVFNTAACRDALGLVGRCVRCLNRGDLCQCEMCSGCQRLDIKCTHCSLFKCACECRTCPRCQQIQPSVCEHGFCANCTCNTCRGRWVGRANRALPDDMMPKTAAWPRFLGYEIEVADCRGERRTVTTLLNSLGWGTATDGSLPYTGIEIRSCPVRGERVPVDLKKVLDVLAEQKVSTNARCGLHIHVDARDLTSRQIVRTFVVWSQIESRVFDLLCPERKANDYCKKLFTKTWSNIDPKKLLEMKREAAQLDSYQINLEAGKGTGAKKTLYASIGEDRYRSLNYQAYRQHKTLEFRLFAPRLDFKYILTCSRLATAVIEFGKFGKFTDLPKFSAPTKIPSTKMTYEKLLRWYDAHVEATSRGLQIVPAAEWKEGAQE